MASKTMTTSQFILEKVGGAENVANLTHCATRLRFQLHDQSKADQKALDSNPDVLGVVPQGTTGLQVVMGGGVADYYQELITQPGMGEGNKPANGKKQYDGVRGKYSWVDYCFEFLSDTFRPVLWALLGASLIITLLVLFDTFDIQDFREPTDSTFIFMHAMWQSVFYFLPVMVGACAARKLGANEWVGAAIPCALLTPSFIGLGEAGDTVTVFGLPMVLNGYSGQVFPPLIAAIGLFWVEKGLKKIIPSAVHMVFVPFFSLLIMIPATAFVFGPFGIGIGNGISNLLNSVNEFSPLILAIIIPMLYPFLVPLGLHWPLNAIMIQNIATLGYDIIQGPMGAWNFACFGTVTGVMFVAMRERDRQMRQVSLGGMMAGLLGGISEPSLYGVMLRFKKSYLRLLPGCFAGGLVMGLVPMIIPAVDPVTANAFVFTSLLTIPAFNSVGLYVAGIAVAFFTSFFLVVLFDYRSEEEKISAREASAEYERNLAAEADIEDAAATSATTGTAATSGAAGSVAVAEAPAPATTEKTALRPGAVTTITAPLAGRVVPLSEVPDPMFSGGNVGKGVAVMPSSTTVTAPGDGQILALFPHAVGIRLDNGIELLVHIGLDTVELEGKGFTSHVEKKQRVRAGDPLITFDPEVIAAAGKPIITPVVVQNHRKFASVEGHIADSADATTTIITVTAK
ncbi:glucose PTS transporter subunit IIA [Corynebacterium meridianum]|uniref:PTS glucose transporter subunit IIA n=1 Tax=Corynebacterium meridianum TaxID=2765363 RepID=A0A934HWI0_9CORY|nr:glucose PTS transporter subunit IIA [Corynebacterium meridianum]MBI8988198.1 PTS glucose transporter subunit IIA [Corynebacterium meridianum]MCK7678329.1 glucose PTS transporter subunit IIA [Corynebacterium meridianum]